MSSQFGPDLSSLGTAYQQAQSIVCFLHPQTTYDAVAAALALQLALEKAGKSCSVVCEAPMRSEYSRLANLNRVTSEVGNRDLVISFAYSEDQVDQVSYNVNEASQRFELIISPKNGTSPLDPTTVQYAQSGLAADIILLFGYHSFDELGEFYQKEKFTVDKAFTVAVTQNKVPGFAKLHVAMQPDQLSYSEWMFFTLRQLQIGEVKDEVATNLLQGIEYATERFQENVPPRTFDTLSQLMRAGGKRMSDNPAFSILASPIRENAPTSMPNMGGQAPQWSPTPVGQSGFVQPNFAPQNFGPTPMTGGVPQLQHSQQVKPVAPSEFAQAMGNRS